MFAGRHAVKIGTHCGEAPDGQLTPKYGRWANEKGALREAFVYRLLDTLGVPSLRARPARITYIDGDQTSERDAFFLEDDRDAMKRLGARREIEPARFRDAEHEFDTGASAR